MEKGISTTKYNEMLREIIAEVKMTCVVVANRLYSAVTHHYWNIGKRLYEFYTENAQTLPQLVAVSENNIKLIINRELIQ